MKKLLVGSFIIVSTFALTACSLDGSYHKNASDSNNTKSSKKAKMPSESFFRNNEAKLSDKTLKITGVKTVKKSQNNPNPLVVFLYTTKNTSNKNMTPEEAWNTTFKVSQNKQKLSKSNFTDKSIPSNPQENIGKNQTVKNSMVYVLKNSSDPISVNASEGINNNNITASTSQNIDGTNLGSQVYNIKN
ncbi:hypothetical protein BGL34_01985 [Fructilactobacillus lindneri]|uniref:DUF5067 domain-containing protein n=2 Tax=Fructilactobacillus lindneri TaxID=53444 RepID=A0A0R2K2A9_9LACO|nr:DUF5067 domain-containing protein [Fructilactobacillus lindneri]ANZ58062.1 hypothetical protein AYR60_04600 [Fructilactobacillus lindneri]ANZ59383.1 hypothetical protein AYR59_04855 [Fructilactobacillus lindneri]KRN80682.1 hypothetical protein IV52_GL001238 [Fructilactobacillus lindneri DSM 20690 = JCM 11027]POG98833.1 hypothetical protein BGL31_02575 [Fructilactobacillus lindneri]POH03106.1 hypothetical protein BGL33_04010 [Fructilactobacillus lindneri]